jgi:hypothetical protein
MTDQSSLRYWVDEAIQSLGYVKPEAAQKLCDLMAADPHASHKSVSTAYRKSGTQLSTEEKKALGIRANAFMTKEAFADLTAKGCQIALGAHEITMRRAAFAHGRVLKIADAREAGVKEWKAMGLPEGCPGCKRLVDTKLGADDISPTGPHDCAREACALFYMPDVRDVLKGSTSKAAEPHSVRPSPWWKFW